MTEHASAAAWMPPAIPPVVHRDRVRQGQALMKPFNAGHWYDVAAELGVFQGVWAQHPTGGLPTAEFVPRLEKVLALAQEAELPASPVLIRGHIAQVSRADTVLGHDVQRIVMEINRRVADEAAHLLCMRVVATDAVYFADCFGPAVRAAFPSAAYDMDECGKSYATGRYTASVFHAIRVLEAGLQALRRAAHIHCNPNWGTTLGGVAQKLKANTAARIALRNWRKTRKQGQQPRRSALSEPQETFLAGAVDALEAFRTAYRNRTAHDPAAQYEAPEARDVCDSVARFMRHLATRLNEKA